MDRCAAAAFEAADASLNRVHGELLARLKVDAATGRRLREAQRAWVEFRDREWVFEGAGVEGGSVRPLVVTGCMTAATRNRTETLGRFLDCQEGDRNCPVSAAR